jgi:membrane carboxypeptidase/penicillin-binding protein
MSLGYNTGAGMGATKNEGLAERQAGEGRAYLAAWTAARKAEEAAKFAGKTGRCAVMYDKEEGGSEVLKSPLLPKEEAEAWVTQWLLAFRREHWMTGRASCEYGSFEVEVEVEVEQVINLTQHSAAVEQTESGVVEPQKKAAVQAALTFDAIPSAEEMAQRAEFLAAIAKESGCVKAMIGGAPFFMSALERALKAHGIAPIYAFSQRESVETIKEDGSVIKTNVFKHVGFVGV